MKLDQILNERAMQILYHLTRVDNAAQILQSGQFKLSASTGTRDRAQAPGHTWTPDHYFLSTARSPQSHFFQDLIGPASVVLVLSGEVLAQRNRVRPHVDQVAKADFDSSWRADYGNGGYNEMEERIYSNSPTLQLPKPLNRVITSVHLMDLKNNPKLLAKAISGVESDASEEGLHKLLATCQQNNIQVVLYTDLNKFKMLRP